MFQTLEWALEKCYKHRWYQILESSSSFSTNLLYIWLAILLKYIHYAQQNIRRPESHSDQQAGRRAKTPAAAGQHHHQREAVTVGGQPDKCVMERGVRARICHHRQPGEEAVVGTVTAPSEDEGRKAGRFHARTKWVLLF